MLTNAQSYTQTQSMLNTRSYAKRLSSESNLCILEQPYTQSKKKCSQKREDLVTYAIPFNQ
jgi:hypothetical protein